MHVGRDLWCGALGRRVAGGGGERVPCSVGAPGIGHDEGRGPLHGGGCVGVPPSQRLGRAEAGPGSGAGEGEGWRRVGWGGASVRDQWLYIPRYT